MITITKEKCTACGQCVAECPSFVLKMQDNIPVMTFEKGCIACGHCVAVCPEAAFDHSKNLLTSQKEILSFPGITAETAEIFLRSRRSVRNFKTKEVEKEKILNILNIARYAPSAGNSQSISYLVVENKEILKKISLLTQSWLGEAENPDGSKRFRYYKVYVDKFMSQGIDVILRDAPVLIVGLAPKSLLDNGFSNTRFALAYAELYATTQGLGSCWAGFFEMCALDSYPPMLELLQVPDSHSITGGIMLGYPKFKYHRLVERNPLEIKFL